MINGFFGVELLRLCTSSNDIDVAIFQDKAIFTQRQAKYGMR
jgi:hypothetical protein